MNSQNWAVDPSKSGLWKHRRTFTENRDHPHWVLAVWILPDADLVQPNGEGWAMADEFQPMFLGEKGVERQEPTGRGHEVATLLPPRFPYTFRQRDTISHLGEHIYSVCFSANGMLFLTGGTSGNLNIWDVTSGCLLQGINLGSSILSIHWANISAKQETFLVGLQNGNVVLYARPALSYIALWGHLFFPWTSSYFKPFQHGFQNAVPGPVESISFSGQILIAIGGRSLLIWNVAASSAPLNAGFVIFKIHLMQSPNTLSDIPNKAANFYKKQPHTVHISPKHNAIVVSFVDPSISISGSVLLLYHLKSFKLLRAIEFNRRMGATAISKAQKYIASTNLVDGIDIFTLPDLTYHGSIRQAVDLHNNLTLGLAFIEDEFIVCGGKGAIFLYRVSSLALVNQLQGSSPSCIYRAVAVASFHQRIAGGSTDGRIALWEWRILKSKESQFLSFFHMPSQGTLCVILVLVVSLYIPIFYIVMHA
ncbi:hypothetical protein GALMADRAFT_147022 [Galerina marginata CBS 339.88]|uniref:Uncharacterized protein n=1 Tax=Galerina marginata (strain CBS 339.88) TaxID=685588 RepID=A0A067SIF7_GALM3|nr:hypothetical protein GALMADRAFT_147022 [Galerina marginata CBS 339.88]